MTTLEHAMLASYGVLATGLYRSWGGQLAGAAGIASILPDWDGLTILISVPLFDAAHRCWGHGLLSCLIVSVIFATLDCRFDFVTRLVRLIIRITRTDIPADLLRLRPKPSISAYLIWNTVIFLAVLSHPFVDMIVSGSQGLSDWEIKIFWPFSEKGLVCPLIPWGDVGVLIIFFGGLFAMIRWKSHVQSIALLTLVLSAIYAILRGFVF